MSCTFCSLWRRLEAWRRPPHSLRFPSCRLEGHLSDMEHTLGVSLFDRSSRGVEPTPYGWALIKRGVAVFDELRLGIREIEFIKDPTIGEVHIGATSTIAEVGIVAAIIDHMSQKYPRVSFHVVEATP